MGDWFHHGIKKKEKKKKTILHPKEIYIAFILSVTYTGFFRKWGCTDNSLNNNINGRILITYFVLISYYSLRQFRAGEGKILRYAPLSLCNRLLNKIIKYSFTRAWVGCPTASLIEICSDYIYIFTHLHTYIIYI